MRSKRREKIERWKAEAAERAAEMQAAAPRSQATAPATGLSRTNGQAIALGLAAAATIIGSFLPWVTASAPLVGTVTKSGIEGGDGWISLVFGGLFAVFAYQLFSRGSLVGARWSPLVTSIAAGALLIFEYQDLSRRVQQVRDASDLVTASIAPGFWLLVVGTGLAFITGFIIATEKPSPDSEWS